MFEIPGVEPDRLDRRFQAERAEALTQQPREVLGAAAGPGEAEPDFRRRQVIVQQAEAKAAHAGLTRGEEAFHLGEQPARGEQRVLRLQHRRGQFETRRKTRRRNEECARLGRPAGGLVDFPEQSRSQAQREALARQPHQSADGADAEIGEQLERRGLQSDRGHRQCLQPAPFAARHPQRRARRGRFADARLETEARQACAQAREEFPAAAEIAQTALDLQQHRLRRLERDARGELAGPAG